MKRLFLGILAAVLVVGLSACGSRISETPTPDHQTATGSASGEMHNIGVLVYSLGDEEVLSFREYLKGYIETVFPDLTFIYSDAITDEEEQFRVMQDMIDSGVEGFMAFNSFDMEKELALCEANGVYYMRPSATVSREEYEKVKDNKYFLGVIGPGIEMEYQAGYDAGEFFYNSEKRKDDNYFILSGGASMGNEMHYERTVGILDALQKSYGVSFDIPVEELAFSSVQTHAKAGDLSVCICPGYLDFEVFLTHAQEEFREDNYSTVISVLPIGELANDIKEKGAHAGVVDCYSTRNLQLFVDDVISYVCGKYSAILGPAVAAMYNAVTGYAEDFREADGRSFVIEQGFWTSDNLEDFTEKYSLATSVVINAYNYEDLYKVCKRFNPDASLDDLKELAKAYTYEDVVARRAE